MAATVFDFSKLTKDRKKFEGWLKEHNLLAASVNCQECLEIMQPVPGPIPPLLSS